MLEVDCQPTGEDLWDPSSVHKRNESIIKLQLITDGYFTAGAQLWKHSSRLFLFQHGVQSLLVIWQNFIIRKMFNFMVEILFHKYIKYYFTQIFT